MNAQRPIPSEDAPAVLRPLPYHHAVRSYLEKGVPAVWTWFTSDKFRGRTADSVRLDLLKSTYRLEREAHPDLHELADRAREGLGLDVPLTLYQTQSSEGLNAFLAYLPGEAHVAFTGPILKNLAPEETLALLGHELTHYYFFDIEEHAYLAAEEILDAMVADPAGDASHEETARLYRLYMEILCDRGGLRVCGDLEATVATLVKVLTGLTEVSASSYLRQAEEILSRDGGPSEGVTHPEVYFRARALALWAEQGDAADAEIGRMIAGPQRLDRLDLLSQLEVRDQTRDLLRCLLQPSWFQTDAVLAHARHFFSDFDVKKDVKTKKGEEPASLPEIDLRDDGMRDYVCYLFADFIALAPELEEGPFAAGFQLADRLDDRLGERLQEVARKEIGVTKKELTRIRKQAGEILRGLEGAS